MNAFAKADISLREGSPLQISSKHNRPCDENKPSAQSKKNPCQDQRKAEQATLQDEIAKSDQEAGKQPGEEGSHATIAIEN